MYKRLAIVLLIFIAIIFVGYVLTKKFIKPQIIHIHAGFLVYKDNKLLDFSAKKYMNVTPCFLSREIALENVDIQAEKAHLHDGVGKVVHVHIKGALWRDLFQNLKYPINYQDSIGYINGVKTSDWQNQPIKQYHNLLLFIGKKNNIQKHLGEKVDKQYIKLIEHTSESCGL